MANKITNLRNWINGEVFNARDYTYERNLIVSLVNNHEDRVTALEAIQNNLAGIYLDKLTTDTQTVAGPITFSSEVILNGTNLDSELESLDVRITDLENAPPLRLGNKTFLQETKPTDLIEGDIWFDSGG
jgi:hypothetical protein